MNRFTILERHVDYIYIINMYTNYIYIKIIFTKLDKPINCEIIKYILIKNNSYF